MTDQPEIAVGAVVQRDGELLLVPGLLEFIVDSGVTQSSGLVDLGTAAGGLPAPPEHP